MIRKVLWVSVLAGLMTLATATSVLAVPGNITLVSTSDAGVKGNANSSGGSMSLDGTKVAFSSISTNLHPGDTDSVSDVYVKDLTSGDVTLVSTSDAGVKGNGASFSARISDDGTKVAFQSLSNLDPADTSGGADIYLNDLTTGEITLVSATDAGGDGGGHSVGPSMAADGTKVAFTSSATNLDPGDTDSLDDIYVKDLTTGDLTLASTSDTGAKGNARSRVASLSDDGTKVAFQSIATNLDPGDTDSIDDIYLKELTTGDVTLASTSDTGAKGNSHSNVSSTSADGARVAFSSSSTNLDPGDTDSLDDIYVKDLTTGELMLVTTSSDGVKGNADMLGGSVSADGTKIAFWSRATNLDPGDTDSIDDIYVKDLTTGDLALASTSDTGVKGNADSLSPGLSADGARVAFISMSSRLDPVDRDARFDVYVKELGEGTPPPSTADLLLTTSDKPDPVTVGANLNYKILVRNLGPDTATGVTLTDELPAKVTFVSAQPRQGTCTQAGGIVTCDLGSLANGARATVNIRVIPTAPGMLSNSASVAANEADSNAANNQETETTTVQ